MLAVPLLLLALAQVPAPAAVHMPTPTPIDSTHVVDRTRLTPPIEPAVDTAAHRGPAPVAVAVLRAPSDTPVVRPRPRAIEYSDLYYTRLQIHRIASYTMLPLFAAEYSLGQNLMQDASPAGWMKPAHALVAGGVGVLFGVNTITGAWNLWDARQDTSGRTRRIVHTVLMLASDGGFALTGALAPDHEEAYGDYAAYQRRTRLHRGVAIGSFALSTVGTAMMWFWK